MPSAIVAIAKYSKMILELFPLILIWFGSSCANQTLSISDLSSEFRFAKYEIIIDNSIVNSLSKSGDLGPAKYTSYRYIIQYGEDVIITISDPGRTMEYLPVIVSKLDYENRIMHNQFFLRNVEMRYSKIDTLTLSIEESRGEYKRLCNKDVELFSCDSILYTNKKSREQFKLCFADSTTNIKSLDLFYPDIRYLPRVIIPNSTTKSVWKLVDYSSEREHVENVIQSYTYEDYSLISEQEAETAKLLYPIDQIKSYFPSPKE
jgi:hypothetical protein